MGFQQDSDRFGGRPRQMHKATCADCKKECEVPFKPSGDRPVYCKECFSKRKDIRG
jgi:CxxC-x17-CxxC domain-containing protein